MRIEDQTASGMSWPRFPAVHPCAVTRDRRYRPDDDRLILLLLFEGTKES